MHSLNPFLRAFFRSTYVSQCTPINQHILLVPTTEVLLTHNDRDSGLSLTELAATDEFLGSHVLRILPSPPSTSVGSDGSQARENRGKAKQFTTANGRTVVIKESAVYSNKGFRNLNQAQLLSDAIYYQDSLEVQQWLIYYISKPLIGALEPIRVPIATLAAPRPPISPSTVSAPTSTYGDSPFHGRMPSKKDVKSFDDLLNRFPLIARQMHSGLERVFKDFYRDVAKPLPSPISMRSAANRSRSSSTSSTTFSVRSMKGSRRHSKRLSTSNASSYADDEEEHMRRTFESAVLAAIEHFQMVDKQQLQFLAQSTGLTGLAVERLIERHVAEHFDDTVLFPRLRTIYQTSDQNLEAQIHQMMDIDVAQVGIDIEGGKVGKRKLTARIATAGKEFRQMTLASSPQQMLDILLETQKILTRNPSSPDMASEGLVDEKSNTAVNADTLVSLLLLVVIRSNVRHLQARFSYMRNFCFIDDVNSGELGYALSTFEAVLQYLAVDSGGLRRASRRNRRLWQATKLGNISEMRTILEPETGSLSDETESEFDDYDSHAEMLRRVDSETSGPWLASSLSGEGSATERADGNLDHVFPFQSASLESDQPELPRAVKRVSMDLRSINSMASEYSFRSIPSTVNSGTSIIEGDLSVEKLSHTEDVNGNSVLMMAIEARQPEALGYLLSLENIYSMEDILEDRNAEGATLLSAAIRAGQTDIIDMLVALLFSLHKTARVKTYLAEGDEMGRTAAHYLFEAPELIARFGTLLPWRQQDKNGQTPLLALARSYDHPNYLAMVSDALQCAMDEQGGHGRLQGDKHVDGRGNTLLHVIRDSYTVSRILQHCDADPNAINDKRFTPLMVASKYGRLDLVRSLFRDERVDIHAREYRGMTAVELAKDDDVRRRIDDMVLVSNPPAADGRVSSVVRSFFVDDGSIRLMIKSASRSGDDMIAVSTCQRSLADFEHLAKWLALEHPASWLPSIFNFRSPFQIPSKPSRAVLNDIQVRIDKFLKLMLAHTTFSTHELLWEFMLAPEIQPDMMAERSMKKAEIRQEKVKEEHAPVDDVRDIEQFVTHARESLRSVNYSTKSVLRRVNNIRRASQDVFTANHLAIRPLSTFAFIPTSYLQAFEAYVQALRPPATDPYEQLHHAFLSIHGSLLAIFSSLARPHAQISTLMAARKTVERHRASLRRADRWPLGSLLEETRRSAQAETHARIRAAEEDLRTAACELSYTQQTVAAELSGWQDLHGRLVRRAITDLARQALIRERSRLDGFRRAFRLVREARSPPEPPPDMYLG